jgi:hypothetical protein
MRRDGATPGGRQPRFAGFDVLAQAQHWDPVTAGVVLARLEPPPPIRFFTPDEEAIARPLLDLLLDQHAEPRVPVLEMIDSRLAEASTDGWTARPGATHWPASTRTRGTLTAPGSPAAPRMRGGL